MQSAESRSRTSRNTGAVTYSSAQTTMACRSKKEAGKTVITMNNKREVPILGLGTWQSAPGEVKQAVKVALECGYRHIDTAQVYLNEAEVGEGIAEFLRSSKLSRDDLFITTKLSSWFMAPEDVKPSCQASLKRLKLDVIDLFLIHTPLGMKKNGDYDTPMQMKDGKIEFYPHDLIACWKAMEELVDAGLVRSIGLSNFNSEQVTRILNNCRIKPVTNQVECHAYFSQNDLSAFCKARAIFLTAFSPIGSPGRPAMFKSAEDPVSLLEHKVITDLAKKYKKTPAQICLRSLVQRGMVVIPKSTNPGRIKENAQIFDFQLSEADMTAIAGINTGKRLLDQGKYGSDERGAKKALVLSGSYDHPEFPFKIPF